MDMIALDIGGVLLAVDGDAPLRALAAASPVPPARLRARITETGLDRRFDEGDCDTGEFLARLRELAHLPDASDEFLTTAWASVLGAYDEPMCALAASLAAQRRLVLASNTDPIHWAALRVAFAARGIDCPALLSFEVGARKPDVAFFRRLPEFGDRVLFVDDKPDNVAAAATVAGVEALVHTDAATTRTRIQAHLATPA